MNTPQCSFDDRRCQLAGAWRLADMAPRIQSLRAQLKEVPGHVLWDLSQIQVLDSFGAVLLWQAWGGQWPAKLEVTPAARFQLELAAQAHAAQMPAPTQAGILDSVAALGALFLAFCSHLLSFLILIGQLFLDCVHLVRNPRDLPAKEISAVIYKAGVQALPVAALVGLMIGIGLSYLSGLQLQLVGADVFIVNILGLGIIRELGPLLAAVLVAGRSGSAMTAQLGVMKVTQEEDALVVMGGMRSLRLVFPKALALLIAMPGIVLWTSAMALLGGMLTAYVQLGMSPALFLELLPKAVRSINIWIAFFKAGIFGAFIALIACHFGLRIEPNTESLSTQTTASVVSAITVVILVDVLIAVLLRGVGIR